MYLALVDLGFKLPFTLFFPHELMVAYLAKPKIEFRFFGYAMSNTRETNFSFNI
jgi:hypothetical protein